LINTVSDIIIIAYYGSLCAIILYFCSVCAASAKRYGAVSSSSIESIRYTTGFDDFHLVSVGNDATIWPILKKFGVVTRRPTGSIAEVTEGVWGLNYPPPKPVT